MKIDKVQNVELNGINAVTMWLDTGFLNCEKHCVCEESPLSDKDKTQFINIFYFDRLLSNYERQSSLYRSDSIQGTDYIVNDYIILFS